MLPDEGRLALHAVHRSDAANWRVGLAKALGAAVRATVFADITEANYSGYARQAPAYGAGAINGAGEAASAGPDLTFQHNGGGVANTIVAIFVLDTISGKLTDVVLLAAAETFAAAGDKIIVTPLLYVSQLP